MAISHTNRRGQIYYLHEGRTKTGKVRYFFSLKADGQLAETLPDGFEAHETPEGQVFLRKILPNLITDEELAAAERELRRHPKIKHAYAERKLEVLTLYVADKHGGLETALRRLVPFERSREIENIVSSVLRYSAELRFLLVDDASRLFQAQRYCYRGSIDDWIDIGSLGSLELLLKKYVRHLGEDSYYDL
jgi:hypothetical protein